MQRETRLTETGNAPYTPFFKALDQMTDPRDKRGQRHNFAFAVGATVLAIMAGRAKVSSIQRYIQHKIEWLSQVSQRPDAEPISRAHLPRLIGWVDLDALNPIVETYLGARLELNTDAEWTAIDGKTLRGTTSASDKQGQRTVLAVPHSRQTITAQREMQGPKSSEITVVRELLYETGLEKGRITFDALHCNPTTTAQVHQAGGVYLTLVKENQPHLLAQCQDLATPAEALGDLRTADKGHGRITTRHATFFSLAEVPLDDRWADSALQTLVVMERTTIAVAKDKTTHETSYYVTNQTVESPQAALQADIVQAIRGHWGVESDNWIRDVTFKEDQVKTNDGHQAQVMASFRTLAMSVFRLAGIQNFQAAIETFTDCPDKFEATLRRVGFL